MVLARGSSKFEIRRGKKCALYCGELDLREKSAFLSGVSDKIAVDEVLR
jgi:hypothetical protein